MRVLAGTLAILLLGDQLLFLFARETLEQFAGRSLPTWLPLKVFGPFLAYEIVALVVLRYRRARGKSRCVADASEHGLQSSCSTDWKGAPLAEAIQKSTAAVSTFESFGLRIWVQRSPPPLRSLALSPREYSRYPLGRLSRAGAKHLRLALANRREPWGRSYFGDIARISRVRHGHRLAFVVRSKVFTRDSGVHAARGDAPGGPLQRHPLAPRLRHFALRVISVL
jgi:hypothetical protein